MRIASISDMHLEHREGEHGDIPDGMFHLFGVSCLPLDLHGAEVLVVAGDTHPDPQVCEAVYARLREVYGIPVITCEGNHEFWGRSKPHRPMGQYEVVNGVSFAVATLWTHLSPMDEIMAHGFEDFKQIKGLTVHDWNEQHAADLDFLMRSKADVIITHHAPTLKSVAPRFTRNSINAFFVNNLDLELLFPSCRLWIHGHTHTDFDYRVGGTRVVCAPTGYPFEGSRRIQIRLIDSG